MIQDYVGKKSVSNVIDTEKKTPLGGKMLKVCFEDGSYEYMPEKRFLIIKTKEPTDESIVRGMLMAHTSKDIGSVVYSLLHEFGCKLSEIEPIISQVAVLANAASDKASDILWQIDYADQRTLNQINDILLENVSKNNNINGSPSNGEGTSPADKN